MCKHRADYRTAFTIKSTRGFGALEDLGFFRSTLSPSFLGEISLHSFLIEWHLQSYIHHVRDQSPSSSAVQTSCFTDFSPGRRLASDQPCAGSLAMATGHTTPLHLLCCWGSSEYPWSRYSVGFRNSTRIVRTTTDTDVRILAQRAARPRSGCKTVPLSSSWC